MFIKDFLIRISKADREPKNYFVYKIFNKQNELIYVGSTIRLDKRIKEHMLNKPWAENIEKVTYARFISDSEMKLYEIYYIITETPKYNSKDNFISDRRILNIRFKNVKFFNYNFETDLLNIEKQPEVSEIVETFIKEENDKNDKQKTKEELKKELKEILKEELKEELKQELKKEQEKVLHLTGAFKEATTKNRTDLKHSKKEMTNKEGKDGIFSRNESYKEKLLKLTTDLNLKTLSDKKILTNMILEWKLNDGKTRLERIIWVDEQEETVQVIDLNQNECPFKRTIKEIDLCIENNSVIFSGDDSFYINVEDLNTLTKSEREFVDKAWNAIKEVVILEPQIFEPNIRRMLIIKMSKQLKLSESTIFNYLKKYWKYGKTKNALIPRFHACGSTGKERTPNDKKLGRPRTLKEEFGEGVNITNEIKQIFEESINQFYYATAKKSLKETYKIMLEKYFSDDSGNKLPEDKIPTVAQFRYWFKKYQKESKSPTD